MAYVARSKALNEDLIGQIHLRFIFMHLHGKISTVHLKSIDHDLMTSISILDVSFKVLITDQVTIQWPHQNFTLFKMLMISQNFTLSL